MQFYKHTVHYYETDKMKITHHSNYIRWMEEARVDFMSQIGWDFDRIEGMGLVSPVTAVSCRFVKSTVFAQEVHISVSVEEFKGVRLKLKYLMYDEQNELVCEGHSEHCFLDEKGRFIRMKKELPELYEILTKLAESSEADPGRDEPSESEIKA